MPVNPEPEETRIQRWVVSIQTKWYWFTVNHRVQDILTGLLAGVLIGLWVS